jgi:hypothetical protein
MLSEKKMNCGYLRMVEVGGCLLLLLLVLSSGARAKSRRVPKACSATALAAYKACKDEAQDDYWIAVGNCLNLADADERAACLKTAKEEIKEALRDCKDQRKARLEVCEELGEAPYVCDIDPNDFVDFEAVVDGDVNLAPNPYFPLVPGTTWEYIAVDANDEPIERIFVEVLEEVTEILGVNCIVVRDRVWEIDNGEEVLVEDTNDWFGQKLTGAVKYFGEIAQEFEDGELVTLEGSWKAGRDFAQAGIIMPADPQVGDFYREEFALGDAEDVARVVSRDEEVLEVPFGVFDDDVVRTMNWTAIEPDVFEFKDYAPGVGLVREVNPDSGERVELVDMATP